MMRTTFLTLMLLLSYCSFAQDTLRTFVFGHSLIQHENRVNQVPSQETSVPHWMYFLAQEDGKRFELDGKYGFIPQHARNEIWSQWRFDSVPKAWNSFIEPFSDADFDNILITPANFIQWQEPTANYWQETRSVIDFTADVFDSVNLREDSLDFYIYENWPDMGPRAASFPPSASEWKVYNDFLNGDFHDWFLEYHDSMVLRFPNRHVKMIPTGPVISKVLNTAPFNTIPIDSLYEDMAPHGRPNIYFLAALTTYMAMYQEKTPASFKPPRFIRGIYMVDQLIVDNYQDVVDLIWEELEAFDFSNGESRVFIDDVSTLVEKQEQASRFELYPNPARDWVRIESDEEVVMLRLYDTKGQEVLATSHKHFNLSVVSKGLYVIEVEFANGAKQRAKLMID